MVFLLNEIDPAVYSLQLHLEDKQLITFKKKDKLCDVVKLNEFCRTMLTDHFRLNQCNEAVKLLLYKEIPQYVFWNKQNKIWTPRKRGKVIGRIVTAHHTKGERYFIYEF